ncbi:hypothetical protein E2C01_050460 [Portunus trituberculatus]|uniref:Uncharacterized protein n=1 Tax=Portunus trituberculatus TaxID=210409 RepID=A0A5B7GHE6_PORTR|nr:hypothetical protein [Portunus trituberculatus]
MPPTKRFPSPKPHSQPPSSPCPRLVVQALNHPLPRFRPSMFGGIASARASFGACQDSSPSHHSRMPPPPPTSRRPHWSFKKGDLVSFQTQLKSIVPPTTLPSDDKIHFLTEVLVTVGSHHFHLVTSFPSRSFQVLWWSLKCAVALQAKRHAFAAW